MYGHMCRGGPAPKNVTECGQTQCHWGFSMVIHAVGCTYNPQICKNSIIKTTSKVRPLIFPFPAHALPGWKVGPFGVLWKSETAKPIVYLGLVNRFIFLLAMGWAPIWGWFSPNPEPSSWILGVGRRWRPPSLGFRGGISNLFLFVLKPTDIS